MFTDKQKSELRDTAFNIIQTFIAVIKNGEKTIDELFLYAIIALLDS